MDGLITHEAGTHGGAFVMRDGSTQIGEMTYRLVGAAVIIDHTEVDPALRGRGLARRLVDAAVGWARRDGLRITPVCAYARLVFDRTPAYKDVRG